MAKQPVRVLSIPVNIDDPANNGDTLNDRVVISGVEADDMLFRVKCVLINESTEKTIVFPASPQQNDIWHADITGTPNGTFTVIAIAVRKETDSTPQHGSDSRLHCPR